VAHGTDVLDFRRSVCRRTPFSRSRKCCLLFYKKNLTERSGRLLPTLMAQTGTWQSRDKRDRRPHSRPSDQSGTTAATPRTTEIGEPAAKPPHHRPPNGNLSALPNSASKGKASGRRFDSCREHRSAVFGSSRVHARDRGGLGALRRGGDTSEASQALLRTRTFTEILEVAKLLREHASLSRSERQNCRVGELHGDAPLGD
jgi:hypothetical protein